MQERIFELLTQLADVIEQLLSLFKQKLTSEKVKQSKRVAAHASSAYALLNVFLKIKLRVINEWRVFNDCC